MLLTGEYINQEGHRIGVEIVTGGERTPKVEVNEDGLYFSDESAVTITGETNDIFDAARRQSATVKIQTPQFMRDLFTGDVTRSEARITRDGKILFMGRVLPQTYSQPYNETLDDLEINLIDHLSALAEIPWRRLMGEDGGQIRLRDLLCVPLTRIAPEMEISLNEEEIYTDHNGESLLEATVNAGIFIDEEEESSDTPVLEAMESAMRYLGLHLIQDGDRFVYFRSETQGRGEGRFFTVLNVAGNDTQIEIGEIWNKVSVSVDCNEREDLFESPLDADKLTSDYLQPEHLQEEASMGTDTLNWQGWRALIAGESYPEASGSTIYTRDWYGRVMKHPGWRFYYSQPTRWDGDLSGHGDEYTDRIPSAVDPANEQSYLTRYLQQDQGTALLRLGTAKTEYSLTDWNPPATLEESDYMIIGIGGDGVDKKTAADDDALLTHRRKQIMAVPRAIYTGSQTGIALSSGSDQTTRYILITGSIALAPVMPWGGGELKTWEEARDHSTSDNVISAPSLMQHYSNLLKSGKDGQRYYLRRHAPGLPGGAYLDMFTEGESAEEYPLSSRYRLNVPTFAGLHFFRDADLLRKIPVLVCMLIVGDKCLVEKNDSGDISALVWEDYKTPEECATYQDYVAQSFTIGVDPKNEDSLIGKWYDVANNVHYSMGLSDSGMAIPVRASDGVSGQVRFVILGPAELFLSYEHSLLNPQLVYNKYGLIDPNAPILTGADYVMRMVSAIWVKDFEVKIVSDNGGIVPMQDGELLYESDTDQTYYKERDPETFLIGSALTEEERARLLMLDTIRDNTVIAPDGIGITSVTDPLTGDTGKPEQMWVDRYWRDCSRPAMELYQTVREDRLEADMFGVYIHPAMTDRRFVPVSIDRDLGDNTARLRIRESRQ